MTDEFIDWLNSNYKPISHKVSYFHHSSYSNRNKRNNGYQVVVTLNGEDLPPFKSYHQAARELKISDYAVKTYSNTDKTFYRRNKDKIKIRTEPK